jgi:hypothetical protein
MMPKALASEFIFDLPQSATPLQGTDTYVLLSHGVNLPQLCFQVSAALLSSFANSLKS